MEICALLCVRNFDKSKVWGLPGAISFSLGAIVAWRYWSLAGPLGPCYVFSMGWRERNAGDPVDYVPSARRKSAGRGAPGLAWFRENCAV